MAKAKASIRWTVNGQLEGVDKSTLMACSVQQLKEHLPITVPIGADTKSGQITILGVL